MRSCSSPQDWHEKHTLLKGCWLHWFSLGLVPGAWHVVWASKQGPSHCHWFGGSVLVWIVLQGGHTSRVVDNEELHGGSTCQTPSFPPDQPPVTIKALGVLVFSPAVIIGSWKFMGGNSPVQTWVQRSMQLLSLYSSQSVRVLRQNIHFTKFVNCFW